MQREAEQKECTTSISLSIVLHAPIWLIFFRVRKWIGLWKNGLVLVLTGFLFCVS